MEVHGQAMQALADVGCKMDSGAGCEELLEFWLGNLAQLAELLRAACSAAHSAAPGGSGHLGGGAATRTVLSLIWGGLRRVGAQVLSDISCLRASGIWSAGSPAAQPDRASVQHAAWATASSLKALVESLELREVEAGQQAAAAGKLRGWDFITPDEAASVVSLADFLRKLLVAGEARAGRPLELTPAQALRRQGEAAAREISMGGPWRVPVPRISHPGQIVEALLASVPAEDEEPSPFPGRSSDRQPLTRRSPRAEAAEQSSEGKPQRARGRRGARQQQQQPATVPLSEEELRQREAQAQAAAEALLREEEERTAQSSAAAAAKAAKQREKRERQKQLRLAQQAQAAQRQQQEGEDSNVKCPGTAGIPGSTPTYQAQLTQEISRSNTTSNGTALAPVAQACEQPLKQDTGGTEAELNLLLSSLGIEAPSASWQPQDGMAAQRQEQGELLQQPCSSMQPGVAQQEPRGPATPPAACLASIPAVIASPEPAPGPEATTAAAGNSSALQPEDDSCVVCMEGPKESVLVPCGHQALCQGCTLELFGTGGGEGRECPICRVTVTQYLLQVFRC